MGHGGADNQDNGNTALSEVLLTDAIYECHIMVVEDSQTSRENIESILRGAGYQNLSFACDGVEAISKVSGLTLDIDLMILDIVMPRLDVYPTQGGAAVYGTWSF